MTIAEKLTAAAMLCQDGYPSLARTVAQIAIDEIAFGRGREDLTPPRV